MVIEVNKDIDRYQESVEMGMAAVFVLAVAGVAAYKAMH